MRRQSAANTHPLRERKQAAPRSAKRKGARERGDEKSGCGKKSERGRIAGAGNFVAREKSESARKFERGEKRQVRSAFRAAVDAFSGGRVRRYSIAHSRAISDAAKQKCPTKKIGGQRKNSSFAARGSGNFARAVSIYCVFAESAVSPSPKASLKKSHWESSSVSCKSDSLQPPPSAA